MRHSMWLILLCISAIGCQHEFDQETKDLLAAISEIPLPPGDNGFSFDTSDTPTDFSFHTEYQGKTVEEIADFYRDFFRENGWVNESDPEEETPGLLVYAKGKAEIVVTTIDVNSKIHLAVLYYEVEYTYEEFSALVKESATSDAMEIVEKVIATYADLESYADTGRQESIDDGELLSTAEFATKYVDSGDLLFEYSDELSNGFKTSSVLSKIGNDIQAMSDYDAAPAEFSDISAVLGTYYGVSDGASGNIPELLFGLEDKTLFQLANLRTIGEAKLEDGTACIRLQGEDYNGVETTLWISKEDYLIRKIEEVTDAKNRYTTTYSPRINIEISPDRMKFRRPTTPL